MPTILTTYQHKVKLLSARPYTPIEEKMGTMIAADVEVKLYPMYDDHEDFMIAAEAE